MAMQTPDTVNPLVLLAGGETLLVTSFTMIILKTKARATILRTLGIAALGFLTYFLEQYISQLCLRGGRPHWAVTAGSLLWVQFLSASELAIVSRVDDSQLPNHNTRGGILSAVGLLWNMRRIGTQWQVKNVPLATGYQSRTAFLLRRIAVTLGTYLFVDALVSMPPPDPALVEASKTTFLLHTLSLEDAIFRVAMTISYWISTGILNLFMTNVGAIVSVLLHLSRPEDCPPLYGSFSEAYTVRRFWGVSWHQMFRSFLTGHADLIVDALPVSLFTYVSGGIFAQTDLTFVLFPIITIWKLNMALRRKIGLCFLMAGSLFGMVSCIMRILTFRTATFSQSAEGVLWNSIEQSLVVILGSMPLLPAIQKLQIGFLSNISSSLFSLLPSKDSSAKQGYPNSSGSKSMGFKANSQEEMIRLDSREV
ncbi:unnamed protein product [Clonostachys chloroleuca]|uniref:Wax synthase domain-containing protein n=1 Tax=Clonostachys chloroleuca TaxID=1926264 RepID=A0AA35QBL8_9HYPO|nr:unnamed protein product [Clonostachys chloroleuca]